MKVRIFSVGLALFLVACGSPPTAGPGVDGGWTQLPDPPLTGRTGANVVGVDDLVVVFGGSTFLCPPNADCSTEGATELDDGALFDLTTRRWRTIADAPVPTALADTAVIDGVVFALTRRVGVTERELIAYDVAQDSWQRVDLPEPTPPLGIASITAAHPTVVLYSTTDELGVTPDWQLDPVSGVWIQLPYDPLGPGFDRSMIWNGDALYVFDKALMDSPGGEDGPAFVRAARYDDTGWTTLPTSDSIGPGPTLIDRHRLITPMLGCADGGTVNGYGRCLPFGAVFDTSTHTWSTLPDTPGIDGNDTQAYGGYSDTHLVGGNTNGDPFFDASTDRWFDLPPLETEDTSERDQVTTLRHTASIGDAIVVIGGERWGPQGGELLNDAYIWTP